MPGYFMQDTPLAYAERIMRQPPNHRPRGHGTIVIHHQYTAADCDCRYCLKAEKQKMPCRSAADCVCFEERLHSGCWSLGDLAEALTKQVRFSPLTERVQSLMPMPRFPYKNLTHHQRFKSRAAVMNRESLPYIAAVFLLSADNELWQKTKAGLEPSSLCFGRISHQNLSEDANILYQLAKDLYFGRCSLTIDSLCDPREISDELFQLIITAFVIRRYGLSFRVL